MGDIPEGRSPNPSPGQEGSQQPKPAFSRPLYLAEDPWTSSTPRKDTSHWTRVRAMLTKFDIQTIETWKEEINTQLVVSSLLSTLTGAFVIETQKDLSEDPIVTSTLLLSHIAIQLNSSIALPHTTLQPFVGSPPNARAINSLLYVSLGFSLSNVTLGLLCLQWLRELKSDTPGITDSDYTGIRNLRHDGFQKWGAKGIISTLPLLLLASLTCFFAGLLLHVLSTDWVVSLPVFIVIGATFSMLVLTTVIPAVVVAGYAAFHPGGLAGSFPPLPPFHSLQSWIALQTSFALLSSPIFKRVKLKRGTVHMLRQCPDWGRIDLYWDIFCTVKDSLFLPLILSTDTPSNMDDVVACLDDTDPLPNLNLSPLGLKIRTLRDCIKAYSSKLPSSAENQLISELLTHLVQYLNSGADLSDIDHFAFESSLELRNTQTSHETHKQLLHALVESFERNLPEEPSSWDFLWNALGFHISTPNFWYSSPMLITRVLDVVRQVTIRDSAEPMTGLSQYNIFVADLSRMLSIYPIYTTTDHGEKLSAAILFHPVWNELASAARAVQSSDPRLDQLRIDLDTLEDIKNRRASLREHTPLPLNGPAQSQSKPGQPHISVDMEPIESPPAALDGSKTDHPPFVPPVVTDAKTVADAMEKAFEVLGDGDPVERTKITDIPSMPPLKTGHHISGDAHQPPDVPMSRDVQTGVVDVTEKVFGIPGDGDEERIGMTVIPLNHPDRSGRPHPTSAAKEGGKEGIELEGEEDLFGGRRLTSHPPVDVAHDVD